MTMSTKQFAGPARLVVLAAIYFASAKLGLTWASAHPNVSPVWPPTGLAIAALLLLGYRAWPAILVGAFLANYFTQIPLGAAAGIAVGNTLEALVAVRILRARDFHNSLDRARDVGALLAAALLATMVSATIGNLSLCLAHAERWPQFGNLWLTWWLGDLVGAMVVGPLILAWATGPHDWVPKKRSVEGLLLLTVLALTAMVTFARSAPTPIQYYPLTRYRAVLSLGLTQAGPTRPHSRYHRLVGVRDLGYCTRPGSVRRSRQSAQRGTAAIATLRWLQRGYVSVPRCCRRGTSRGSRSLTSKRTTIERGTGRREDGCVEL